MKNFKYELIKHVATISQDDNGNSLQINIIAYNNSSPKLDIRRWKNDIMLKGLVLNDEEAEGLLKALEEWKGE